jgi:hypothetical protein
MPVPVSSARERVQHRLGFSVIAMPVDESQDEVIFQLDDGTRFKVSPIDKQFVLGGSWYCTGMFVDEFVEVWRILERGRC